jgi:tetratricopeptide (TPR) repeat protein
VLENIEKAIELNPDNVDYRWIRARCLMNKRTQEIAVIRAIEDINFMLSKGESSAKVYNLLALAYSELGEKYRLKKAKKSGGFSDDDTDYVKTQTGYYNEAITNYEKAINAYNKMIEIKPDTSESVVYKVRELEEEIKDINELRSKLK